VAAGKLSTTEPTTSPDIPMMPEMSKAESPADFTRGSPTCTGSCSMVAKTFWMLWMNGAM